MEYPENIEEIKKFAKEIKLDVKYLLGERYGYSLSLSSVRSLPDNIVFNVGDWLVLDSVQSLPANTKFNVDGNIYLPMKHKVKVIW
jgi:hypothetical protein